MAPCGHPVQVAAQRVDLAVVGDHPERVRQVPGRKGVGREALVHQGERRHHAPVGEVRVVGRDLVREQHALVDDGARGERGHVETPAVRDVRGPHRVLHLLSQDEELALEGVPRGGGAGTAHEHLPHAGLDGPHALREPAAVGRHVAPSEQALALGLHVACDELLAGLAPQGVAGQEQHADAVVPGQGELEAEPRALRTQERVGHLQEDAGAVTGEGIGAHCPAMGQVGQDPQAHADDFVALAVVDLGAKTHAAGVVLEARVIETPGPRPVPVAHRGPHWQLALVSARGTAVAPAPPCPFFAHGGGETGVPARRG